MNKVILTVVVTLSFVVIAYILLGYGDGVSEVSQSSQTLLEMHSHDTQIEKQQIVDRVEQELESELNKIENNEEAELTEEIE